MDDASGGLGAGLFSPGSGFPVPGVNRPKEETLLGMPRLSPTKSLFSAELCHVAKV